MRNLLVILFSTVLTIMNVNCYGDLDPSVIEKAKVKQLEKNECNVSGILFSDI